MSTAAQDQPFFDFFLSGEDAWHSPKEAGDLLCGLGEDFIRDAWESGAIPGFAFNSGGRDSRERYKRYVIPRSGLILYASEQANFTGEDYFARVRALTKTLSPAQKAALVTELTRSLGR